jgi:hypothetical protein
MDKDKIVSNSMLSTSYTHGSVYHQTTCTSLKHTKLIIPDFTVGSDMYSSAFTFRLVLSHRLDISLCETAMKFISWFQSVNIVPVSFVY